jgi:hypothetical protein
LSSSQELAAGTRLTWLTNNKSETNGRAWGPSRRHNGKIQRPPMIIDETIYQAIADETLTIEQVCAAMLQVR